MRIRPQNVSLQKRCCIGTIQAERFIFGEGSIACQLAFQQLVAGQDFPRIYPLFHKGHTSKLVGIKRTKRYLALIPRPYP